VLINVSLHVGPTRIAGFETRREVYNVGTKDDGERSSMQGEEGFEVLAKQKNIIAGGILSIRSSGFDTDYMNRICTT